jgi:hypothetical protein
MIYFHQSPNAVVRRMLRGTNRPKRLPRIMFKYMMCDCCGVEWPVPHEAVQNSVLRI